MIDAAILRRLAALALPSEAFQEVLSIIADLQTDDEKRRERSRQRTSRWRHRDNRGDVTVTAQEHHSNDHTPPRAYTTPPKKKINPKADLSIPIDFQADLEFATARSWTLEYARAEAQRFRDHALAKGRKARDWQAAWRNWVTSPYQQTQKVNGNGAGHSTMEAFDRLIDRAAGEAGDVGAPMLDITPGRA